MSNKRLSNLIKIAVLAGMALILMAFLEFPLPFFTSFLKIDLSDIPALLGAFAMGPLAGVIIEFIKTILYIALRGSSSAGIGELANFIVGSALVITAGGLYRRQKTRKNALLSMIAGILVMTVVASAGNYYVFVPLYAKVLHWQTPDLNAFIAYTIIPFNLIKGLIEGLLTFVIYKRLSTVLHR